MIELPDVPRWVEAHGIAADASHWRTPLGDGVALGHDDAKLIVIAGDADPPGLDALARSYPQHTLLLGKPAVLDRPLQRAIIHALPDVDSVPDLEGAVLLDQTAPLPDSLADSLADELRWAKRRGPVFTVYLDGTPAAFAYAPWRSAKYFDVSVDTVIGARQLGLATIVSAAMIHHELARGLAPVWGADEHNAASLGLARRLGFVAVDELWVAACAR